MENKEFKNVKLVKMDVERKENFYRIEADMEFPWHDPTNNNPLKPIIGWIEINPIYHHDYKLDEEGLNGFNQSEIDVPFVVEKIEQAFDGQKDELITMLRVCLLDYESKIPQSDARDNRMRQIKEIIANS